MSMTRHFLASCVALLTAAPALAQTTDCTNADKAQIDTWFSGPNHTTPMPPVQLSSGSICSFHVWSWQAFLHLTDIDPATGKMVFLGYLDIDELFADSTAPIAASATSRAQRTLTLRPRAGKQQSPKFHLTGGSSSTQPLSSIGQAGSDGALVDQNGRIVYYEQLFNQALRNFIVTNFYGPDPSGSGKDVFLPGKLESATDPNSFFDSGLLELKTSWMIVPDGAEETISKTYLVIPAQVYALEDGGQDGIQVNTSEPLDVHVALVGFHVAGTVDDHPEMIWATFEQTKNAPNLPAGMDPKSTEPVVDSSSPEMFTFYKNGTPARASNDNEIGNLKLDGQTLSPVTNVFREFTNGTPNGAVGGQINVSDIDWLNQLTTSWLQSMGDVRQNYFEVGAIWMLPNTLEPGQFPVTQLRGSTMLSNSTIETFTQTDQQCFSCHNTLPVPYSVGGQIHMLPATNFNISHALVDEWKRTVATTPGMSLKALR